MKMNNRNEFAPAKSHAKLTSSEVIRMLRNLMGWTQVELAKHSGINATNLSLLENDRVEIGKRRAEQFAMAFDIHPLSSCSQDMKPRKSKRQPNLSFEALVVLFFATLQFTNWFIVVKYWSNDLSTQNRKPLFLLRYKSPEFNFLVTFFYTPKIPYL